MFFVKMIGKTVDAAGTSAGVRLNFGMGVALLHDGRNCYVLTNAHVIDGASNIYLTAWSGTPIVSDERAARRVWSSEDLDAAIVDMQVAATDCQAIASAAPHIKPGALVFAYGQPLPELGVVTAGRVAGIWNLPDLGPTILGDFRAAPGHSGSGVFDESGALVGIVTAKTRAREDFVYILPICRIVLDLLKHQSRSGAAPSGADPAIGAISTRVGPWCMTGSSSARWDRDQEKASGISE